MHALQLLSLVPLALASPILDTRQACPAPSTFQINGLTTFTPSPTQNPNGNSTINFGFVDTTTGVSTSCSRTGPASGPGDANTFYPCANPDVSFLYAGQGLAFDVKEIIHCPSGVTETAVSNSSSVSTFCFGITPPFPGGFGTLCESPVSAFQVDVTSIESN